MSSPINDTRNARGLYVYVVTALDDGRVKEQIVFASLFDADECFRKLQGSFGGANVALTSRCVQ